MLHLTDKNFEPETTKGHLPVIVMFYASWCGKCAMMKPIIEDIEKKYLGRIKFCETNIDESPGLAAKYEADIVPTFILFKEKKIIGVLQGIIDQNILEKRIQNLFRIT